VVSDKIGLIFSLVFTIVDKMGKKIVIINHIARLPSNRLIGLSQTPLGQYFADIAICFTMSGNDNLATVFMLSSLTFDSLHHTHVFSHLGKTCVGQGICSNTVLYNYVINIHLHFTLKNSSSCNLDVALFHISIIF